MYKQTREEDLELFDGLSPDEMETLFSFLTHKMHRSREEDHLHELAAPYKNIPSNNIEVDARFSDLRFFTKGGCNRIFTAFDTETLKNVLIKVPNEGANPIQLLLSFDKYQEEYSILKRLNELGIKEVPKVVWAASTPIDDTDLQCSYLVINFVEGRSLLEFLYEDNTANPSLDVVFQKICEGVSKVHKAGIIHRDLNPKNIIVDNDNEISIIDWESSVVEKNVERVSVPDEFFGTRGFCSPERANSETCYSMLDDIYALGSTLALMYTRKKMFLDLTPEEADAIHQKYQSPPLLEKIDSLIENKAVVAVIRKAVHVNPEMRYQSVDELISDFKLATTINHSDCSKLAGHAIKDLRISI